MEGAGGEAWVEGRAVNVGFTGTRLGMSDYQKKSLEAFLLSNEVEQFHHGSCVGADVQAAKICRDCRPHTFIVAHPGFSMSDANDKSTEVSGVDSWTMPILAYFARNRLIVDSTDVLVACPYTRIRGVKGGTWYTIKYAKNVKRKTLIIWPAGDSEWS